MVTDLCSIGTLFAFVLVCAGVLVLQNKPDVPRGKFKTPYINAKFIFPSMLLLGLVCAMQFFNQEVANFVTNAPKLNDAHTLVTSLNSNQSKEVTNHLYDLKLIKNKEVDLEATLSNFEQDAKAYHSLVDSLPIAQELKYELGFSLFKHKIPMWIFLITLVALAAWAYQKNLSLIPLLGLVSCLYMMAELSVWNWIYFSIWLLIGLTIYFGFSYKNSKLNNSVA